MTPDRPIAIKICGLTRPEQAAACAAAGADAIGLVFHPASPRCVDAARARAIVAALPAATAAVGVFVDVEPAVICRVAEAAGLHTVQLHGSERPEWMRTLLDAGLHVVCALRATGPELVQQAAALPAGVDVLVECGVGVLPGGNGAVWDWSLAAVLRGVRPFALAGGLTPASVAAAVAASGATAVDVSSGVECRPGDKDLELVGAFIAAVRAVGSRPVAGTVFHVKERARP